MKLVAIALVAAVSAPVARAQHLRSPSHWHYDPYAQQLGAQHYPGGGAAFEDGIAAVESLPSGAVLVAGFTFGSLGESHAGSSSTADAFLARFDAFGNLEWVRQIGAVTGPTIPALNGNPSGPGGNATGSDFANDLAVAADGSIFVTGSTSGSLGETSGGSSDLFLAKFGANGALLWLRQLGAQTAATLVPEPGASHFRDPSQHDVGLSIALHADGGAVVGGITASNLTEECISSEDFVALRYDAQGQIVWVRQMSENSAPSIGYSAPSCPFDEFEQIALHPSGRIVLVGTAWGAVGTLWTEKPILMTFDAAGVPLQWVTTGGFTTSFRAVQIHPGSGRILVAGANRFATDDVSESYAMAASYDASLNLEWMTVIDHALAADLGLQDVGSEGTFDLRLDSLGNLILAGTTGSALNEPFGGGSDLFTAKVRGGDGRALWVSQLGLTTAGFGFDTSGVDRLGPNGLALGPAGTILVGGSTNGSFGENHAGQRDALLLRLDRNGKLR